MTFRSPFWLWLAAAAPLALLFLIWRERVRSRLARRFASERLRGVANPARAFRPFLLSLGVAAAAVALAGPQLGFHTVPMVAAESNRVIVIDVSSSMAAEDVGSSRLAAAKSIAKRLIESEEGRVALVVFEQSADVLSPLTNDSEAVVSLVETLEPGETGDAGSDIAAGIISAVRLLQSDTTTKADVVLISDGEDQGHRSPEAVQRARSRSIEVSTVLVGTEEGALIPTGQGVLRDESGDIVRTRANRDVLERIASGTGGRFLENPFSRRALDPLLIRRARGAEREKPVRVPIDRYQWPLAFAFVALLCGSFANRGAE